MLEHGAHREPAEMLARQIDRRGKRGLEDQCPRADFGGQLHGDATPEASSVNDHTERRNAELIPDPFPRCHCIAMQADLTSDPGATWVAPVVELHEIPTGGEEPVLEVELREDT